MKKSFVLVLVLTIGAFASANAQAVGDYRSAATGSWGTLATWERLNSTGPNVWVTPTVGQGYPGQNSATATVTIRSAHTVTGNVTPANFISALAFEANNGTNSQLSMGTGITLSITNAITFTDPANNRDQTLAVNDGTVICGSITMTNTSGATRRNIITVASSGTLTVNGTITTSGAATENFVTLTGTGILNIGGAFAGGTFAVSNTGLASTMSTVKWFGDNTNFRNDISYGNLIIEIPATAAGSRTKTPTAALVVLGDFTAQSLHATNTISLDAANNSFSVSGITRLNARGRFTDSNGGGTNTFTGNVRLATSSIFVTTSITAPGGVIFNGGIDNSGGSFTAGGATFNTNAQTISGTSALSFANNVSITGILVDYSNTGDLTITGSTTITGAGGFTDSNDSGIDTFVGNVSLAGTSTFTTTTVTTTGNLVFRGGITNSGTSFSAGSATFNTNGQAISGTTATSFSNDIAITGVLLTYSNSNNLTVTGTTTISGAGGFTDSSNNGIDTFVGNVSLAGTATFTTTAVTNTGNLIFRGGITNSGTSFSAGGATFDINDQVIAGSTAMSFANIVTISGATVDITNNNTNTVTLSNTGAATLTGTGGASWIQGSNSTLSFAGSTMTSITLTAASNTPNTVTYTGAAATIFPTSYNNLTYSGTTTGTIATGTTVNVSGNLTSTSGTLTGAGTGTVVFNGIVTQTISGAGAFSFANLTLAASGAFHVTINKGISISGALDFTAANARLLVLGSGIDVTFGKTASVTNADADSYVQTDEASGANNNLIKITGNNTTDWVFSFPVGGATGGYTPINIPTINTAPTDNSTLSVKSYSVADRNDLLKRNIRLTVTGNSNATNFSNAVFGYNDATDISTGDVETDYTTAWRQESGVWSTVASSVTIVSNTFTVTGGSAATASLATGTYYYTIGTINAYHTWYSYQTGNYSDFNTWTLDPSGTTFDNGLNLYPSSSDQIHILNGFTVTVDLANQILESTAIDGGGILDLSTTSGHDLGVVTGTGTLKVKGTSLPTGTYTDFVSTSGGTVEYYDAGGTLSTTQTTYNKLRMTNSTVTDITFIQGSNLTVNGTFDITTTGTGKATWQINNGTASRRTIILNDDLTVSANGRIRASTSGVTGPHLLTMYGDLTNSGSIKFFDDTDTQLEDADYTSLAIYTNALKTNAVNVTFSGTIDQLVTCNGQTDFYRLIMNKGTGQQAMLTINSSGAANFRLFGPNNQDYSGPVPNYISDNNLSIVNGTLQLTGTITIPSLVVNGGGGAGGGWPIPENGALWINGTNVSITTTNTTDTGDNGRQIYVFGLLKMTAGTLTTGYSRGILGGGSGSITVEGGTINTWQLRTTYLGSNNRFAYNQSGGIVNIGTTGLTGVNVNQYPRFALPYAECSFIMSGGTINVANPLTGGITTDGGILIFAATSNIQVTGGTVNAICPASGTNFRINTTAPFYDLNVSKAGAGASVAILNSISFNDGTTFTPAAQPLTVLNNLTITTNNTPVLNCNSLALSVAGNLDVQTGTTLTSGTNTITFNGTSAQTWTHNGTITANLNNVVVNKSAGTLTLAGSGTFPDITGALTLTSGTLADGGKTITVSGTGTLSNSATHSGTGSINYTSTAATIGGSAGTFGNLTINPSASATVAISGNQIVNGVLRLIGASTSLNIASYSLNALGNIYNNASPGTGITFTSTNRILTSGFHNAGGLTRSGTARDASNDLLFPVGTSAIAPNPAIGYTPITIRVTAGTHGTITVRAVNSVHPVVTSAGHSLAYYWRVTSSGYLSIATVSHNTYTYSTSAVSGTTASYQAARYDPTTFSWSTTGSFDAGAVTIIPNFSFGNNIDGEYTAGDNTSPFGLVKVFYSKTDVATPGAWNQSTTWSNASLGGAAITPAGSTIAGTHFPGSNNPVVIGDVSNAHGVIIDQDSRSCGTLGIGPTSVLDCSTFISLNFGTNTGSAVTGTGRLRIAAVGAGTTNMFPAGDFTNFLGASGGTVEWYGATKTIPATGPTPQSLSLANYYNLVLNPSAGNTITLPASNLTIYNNLTQGDQAGFTGTSITNGPRTIAISGGFNITLGIFNFSNVAASATTMTVTGSTTVANGATLANQTVPAASTNINTISTSGGITNNGTLNFNNTGGTTNITFSGTGNVTFGGTGSGGTTLSRIIVNKGSSQTPTVDFSVGGTVTTTPVASGWLTLTNGTFSFNNSQTYTISSDAYTIPSTAKLKVNAGTVNVMTTSANANDLFLNGALEVSGTGAVSVGNTTVDAFNSDIEYAAAGTPTITVSSSSASALKVKSSIRRSTSSLSGALVYNQTAGTVTVYGISSNNTRGVFEIDSNSGSSFTLTGTGILNVQRQTGGTGYADVFINPISSNVASTSTLSIGEPSLATNTNFRINIAPAIGSFSIVGTNAHTVNLFSNPMVLSGTLTVTTPSILVTNSLDVTIAGDLICTGTYTGGTNTTTFNGSGAQSATLSASGFYNMTVNKSAGTVTLSGVAPTLLNNLNILSGTLSVGSLVLPVGRDITINSSQIGAGSILVSSTNANSNTITSSGGSFTNLTLGGTATTKTVNVSGALTINGTLNFSTTNRYLMIGSSRLTFGASAAAATGVGATAFVRTNGVSSDLGVTKTWGTGTSTFVYPIGTSTNYTPVSFSLNVSGAGGTLNVIPVNSAHPTYNQASPERILNYYWTISKGGTLTATATTNHTYTYPSSLITGTDPVPALVAGYLNTSNPVGWITTGHGGTATTTQMDFTNAFSTNIPAAGLSYDYTVGTSNTLPNPIVPLYSRKGLVATVGNTSVGAPWTTASNWTTDTDGDMDLNNPSSVVPTAVPIVILTGSRINAVLNGRRAFKTTLNGILDIGTTTGHSIGVIDGTGTFRAATGTFPAGDFTPFTLSTGGTIEYVAPATMNNRNVYNNLSIYSGTPGTVTMTAAALTINGNVTIPTGTILNGAPNTGGMAVAGSWSNVGTFTGGSGAISITGNLTNSGTYNLGSSTSLSLTGNLNNSGTFNPGALSNFSLAGNLTNTGTFTQTTGTVTFSGSAAQNTSGVVTFYNLTMNKTNNVTLGATANVNGALTMTAGNIISNAFGSTPLLVLGASATTSGGSSSSFVSGQIRKTIDNGSSFTFPVGSNSTSRYRPVGILNSTASPGSSDTWDVSYIPNSPTTDGFSSLSFDNTNMAKVSNYEYWQVANGTGTTTAAMSLRYDVGSYGGANIGDETKLKTVRWNALASTPRWEIPPGGGGFTLGPLSSSISGTVIVSFQNAFSPQTLATDDINSSLPIELLNFTARLIDSSVDLNWSTASELNNDYFTIERASDIEHFEEVAKIKGKGTVNSKSIYSLIDDSPLTGTSYYRLKQTDFDGNFSYSELRKIENSDVKVNFRIYPNPIVNNKFNFELTGVDPGMEVPLKIVNLQGSAIFEASYKADQSGRIRTSVELTPVSSGMYIVIVNAATGLRKKIVIP